MSLFSFLRKNKQEPASEEGAYYSRAEEDSQNIRTRGKRKQPASARREDPADPVLPEKKRARRRLIGAVALVLAAIIGLPMILDAEPKPLVDDIAIQIPSRDKSTPIVDSSEQAPAGVEPAVALDASEELLKDVPLKAPAPAPTVASTPLAAPAPVAVKTAPATASIATPKTASAPATVATSVATSAATAAATSAAPVPSVAPKLDDSARALALLEGRPDPRAADKKAEKYVIQIAALTSAEKVNELQGKLKGAGIKSYTQPVATAGGGATRVRVGPFSSRDEAEKMRERIVKLGLSGTVVPS